MDDKDKDNLIRDYQSRISELEKSLEDAHSILTSYRKEHLNTLEQVGFLALLERLLVTAKREYPKMISNGWSCRDCDEHGFGTSVEHKEDCTGRALVKQTEDAIAALSKVLNWRKHD